MGMESQLNGFVQNEYGRILCFPLMVTRSPIKSGIGRCMSGFCVCVNLKAVFVFILRYSRNPQLKKGDLKLHGGVADGGPQSTAQTLQDRASPEREAATEGTSGTQGSPSRGGGSQGK